MTSLWKSDGRKVTGRQPYNKKLWPLCECCECGKLRYVEPHGVTATCDSKKCEGKDTEHVPLQTRGPR